MRRTQILTPSTPTTPHHTPQNRFKVHSNRHTQSPQTTQLPTAPYPQTGFTTTPQGPQTVFTSTPQGPQTGFTRTPQGPQIGLLSNPFHSAPPRKHGCPPPTSKPSHPENKSTPHSTPPTTTHDSHRAHGCSPHMVRWRWSTATHTCMGAPTATATTQPARLIATPHNAARPRVSGSGQRVPRSTRARVPTYELISACGPSRCLSAVWPGRAKQNRTALFQTAGTFYIMRS